MRPLGNSRSQRRAVLFAVAVVGTGLVAAAPSPSGLSTPGQYALATMFFAGFLWVTATLPLPVTALSIPFVLTAFGVYAELDVALAGFADPIIFLFLAGFMLANALQKYDIDRRIALWLLSRMGTSPRRLVAAVMLATAFLSMWVSNTATAAMMTPIAVGILALGAFELETARRADNWAIADVLMGIWLCLLAGTTLVTPEWGIPLLFITAGAQLVRAAGDLGMALNLSLVAILAYSRGAPSWAAAILAIAALGKLLWFLREYYHYDVPLDVEAA